MDHRLVDEMKENAKLLSELAKARAIIDRLTMTHEQARDTERLNWLEKHRPNIDYQYDKTSKTWQRVFLYDDEVPSGTLSMGKLTFRDAIDEAMQRG